VRTLTADLDRAPGPEPALASLQLGVVLLSSSYKSPYAGCQGTIGRWTPTSARAE
jgi:hypothetical protein